MNRIKLVNKLQPKNELSYLNQKLKSLKQKLVEKKIKKEYLSLKTKVYSMKIREDSFKSIESESQESINEEQVNNLQEYISQLHQLKSNLKQITPVPRNDIKVVYDQRVEKLIDNLDQNGLDLNSQMLDLFEDLKSIEIDTQEHL
mmetsp:Transcript_17948/g.15860  ORF Transcript_17948/g.15860 Transcript_17948/m.15860 type:complete len:145 (-) Transcript_17948:1631-2065(-)